MTLGSFTDLFCLGLSLLLHVGLGMEKKICINAFISFANFFITQKRE